MIANVSVIHSKVLKQTLIEQISRIRNIIFHERHLIHEINRLTQQIPIQIDTLELVKNSFKIKLESLKLQKISLKEQLRLKRQQKASQMQIAKNLMIVLKQNCSQVRQMKQSISDLKPKQSRLINELQQFQIKKLDIAESLQIIQLRFQSQKKLERQAKAFFLDESKVIESKRQELLFQRKLQNIENEEVLRLQSQGKEKTHELRQIEVNLAQTKIQQEQISVFHKQTTELHEFEMAKHNSLHSKLSSLKSQLSQKSQQFQGFQRKHVELGSKLEDLIEKSNTISDKLIKIKEQKIKVNIQKNNQKKVNALLKNKVRQIMRLVTEE